MFEREAREFNSYPSNSTSITVSLSLHTQDYTNIVCITHISVVVERYEILNRTQVHNQLEDIRRSEKGAIIKKIAYDKVSDKELEKSTFAHDFQEAERRMTVQRKASIVVLPSAKVQDQRT